MMIRRKSERVPPSCFPTIPLRASSFRTHDKGQNEKAARQQGSLFFKGE